MSSKVLVHHKFQDWSVNFTFNIPSSSRNLPFVVIFSRFDFYTGLQMKLKSPANVVPVFDKVQMQGDKGAVATVNLPLGNYNSSVSAFSATGLTL